MRRLVLLALLVALAGCESTRRIDRATLDERYQQTQLAKGVLSIVPLRVEPNQPPPVVVNWWYAGSSDGQHSLVYRELTWDNAGNPVGTEQRYRIAQNALKIQQPFASTRDAGRWMPLFEAADEIEPPADLPTARKAPVPIDNDPVRRPEQPVVPPSFD